MKNIVRVIAMLFSTFLFAQNEGWTISSGKVDQYTGIVTANGRIGILPEDRPFETRSVIMNNVYDKESPLGVSRILLGMNFANLEVSIDEEIITEENITDFKQVLDMKTAAFTTSFKFKDKAEVSYTIYALRNVQYSGYVDVKVIPTKSISFKASGKITTPEEYQNPVSTFRVLRDLETTMPILQNCCEEQIGKAHRRHVSNLYMACH